MLKCPKLNSVTKDDGTANVFRASANGLYYPDATAAADKDATVLVNTVKDKKNYVFQC